MKKKMLLLFLLTSTLFLSCLSTFNINQDLSEIDFKEITFDEYNNKDKESLYSTEKGYKIKGVFLDSYWEKKVNYWDEYNLVIEFGNSEDKNGWINFIADYYYEEKQSVDKTWFERFRYGINSKKYNGKFNIYLYKAKVKTGLINYRKEIRIYNIEGIPSQEDIYNDKTEWAIQMGFKNLDEYEQYEKEKELIEKRCSDENFRNILYGGGIPLEIGDEILADFSDVAMSVYKVEKESDNSYIYWVGFNPEFLINRNNYRYVLIRTSPYKPIFLYRYGITIHKIKYIKKLTYSTFDYRGNEETHETYLFEIIK